MIIRLKTILPVSVILLSGSCSIHKVEPSAETVTKFYDFNRIESIMAASPAIIVSYSQGDATYIKAEGPVNMMDALRIRNESNMLMIEVKDIDAFNITSDAQFIKVWISAPDVKSFDIMSGASIIVAESICSPTDVTINAYTGGKAIFSDIKSKYLTANAFQNSEISIDRVQASHIEAAPYTGSTIIIAGDTIKTVSGIDVEM